MGTILINGIVLKPQPISREWQLAITGNKLNGTQETAAYYSLILQAPKMNGQYFNWQDFENQVLNSITVFPPGSSPDCNDYQTYINAVARMITTYQIPDDNTVNNVSLEIMVLIEPEFSSFV